VAAQLVNKVSRIAFHEFCLMIEVNVKPTRNSELMTNIEKFLEDSDKNIKNFK
jgi:hypothetical protein